MADLGDQLQIQAQINKAISARSALIEKQSRLLSKQAGVAANICKSLDCQNLDETEQGIRGVSDALEGAADAAESAQGGTSNMSGALGKAGGKAAIATKVFGAFGDALDAGMGMLTNAATGVFNLVGAIGKLSIAILSAPLKMWSALIKTAQDLPRSTAIADALEEIRDQFGDIARGPGRAVARQLGVIQGQASNLAGTGLSVSRAFGHGAEGVAAALKAVNELAVGTGDAFYRLQGVFKKSGLRLAMMQKGMGLSAESMGQMMSLAESMGKNVEKTMNEFAKTSIRTAKRFGMSVKVVSKGMAEMITDVQTFGHLGPKAFAPMVVYAKKLGIQIKDLAGVMSKFAGFSDTAQAASQMNQAFGMNVDSMKLMAAQNPAEKIDILRKSFFRAGKDISKFSYQQKQLLSQLTGLEGQSLAAAFSLDKQGLSYKSIEKQSEKANKKQMTQKQVMADLGKQIKKLNKLLDVEKLDGFFDAFIGGFGTGVLKAKDMKDLLKLIRKSLHQVFLMGRRVGKAFVESFPGVLDMITALKEFLDPKVFTKFVDGIEDAFKALFKGGDWVKFFDDLEKTFKTRMGPGGRLFKKAKAAIGKFATFVMEGLGVAIEKAATILSEKVLPAVQGFLDDLTKEMAKKENKGKGLFSVLFGMAGKSDWAKKVSPIFKKLMKSLQVAWKKIVPKLKKLWETLWPILEPILWDIGKAAGAAFAVGFFPSLATSLLSLAGGMAFNHILGKLVNPKTATSPAVMSNLKNFTGRFAQGASKVFKSGFSSGKMLTKAGFIGVGIMVAKGIYDGIKAGMNSPKSGAAAFGDASKAFGASILSTMSMGMISPKKISEWADATGDAITQGLMMVADGYTLGAFNLTKRIRKAQKEIKEAAQLLADTQARAMKGWRKEAEKGVELTARLYKESLAKAAAAKTAADEAAAKAAAASRRYQKGIPGEHSVDLKAATADRAASEADAKKARADAISFYAQQEALKLVAAGKIEQSSPAYTRALNNFKVEAGWNIERHMKEMAEKMKKEKITAEEEKRLSKLAVVHTLTAQIESIADLQTRLKASRKNLKKIKMDQVKADLTCVAATFVAMLKVVPEAIMESKMSAVDSTAVSTNLIKDLQNLDNVIVELGKVTQAGDKLTPEKLAKVQPVLDAMKDFTGGHLSVSHNLPNTKIVLHVSLDSEKLATEILQVELKTGPQVGPYKQQYVATGKDRTNIPTAQHTG